MIVSRRRAVDGGAWLKLTAVRSRFGPGSSTSSQSSRYSARYSTKTFATGSQRKSVEFLRSTGGSSGTTCGCRVPQTEL